MPFSFDSQNILIYSLLAVVFLMLFWILRSEMRMRKLLLGKSGVNLEDSIVHNKKEIEDLRQFEKQSKEYFKNVEARLRQSIRGVETVRFNPFKGTGQGGGQSFSTSFINEEGDGVVISSLYSRDRVSIFAKPLKNFRSDFELSEEEKESMDKAKTNTHIK